MPEVTAPMTRAETIAAVAALVPSLAGDLADPTLSDADVAAILRAELDARKAPDVDTWTRVLDVLRRCADVAAIVTGIEPAIAGIVGLVAAGKAAAK